MEKQQKKRTTNAYCVFNCNYAGLFYFFAICVRWIRLFLGFKLLDFVLSIPIVEIM